MDRTRRPKPLTYQVSFDSEKVQEEEAEGGRMTNVLDFAGAKWPIFVRILVLSQYDTECSHLQPIRFLLSLFPLRHFVVLVKQALIPYCFAVVVY